MIATLVGFGLPNWAAKAVAYVALPLLALFLVWLAIDSYGDSRYREGERDTDAKWIEAGNKLIEQERKAAAKADENAAGRAADFAAKQEDEKEKIDEAVAEGRSAFDALFPVDDGLH